MMMISRRAAIGKAAIVSVFGRGGTPPRPVNAPDGYQPQPGVQPGQSQGIVVARRVVVFGPDDGIYVYNGSPGPNKLLMTVLPASGADPYGNVTFTGLSYYNNNAGGPTGTWQVTNIGAGGNTYNFLISTTGQNGAFTQFPVFSPGTTGLTIASPTPSTPINLQSADAVNVNAGPLNAQHGLNVTNGATTDTLTVTGQLTATGGTPSTPTLISTDSWHSMSAAGFLNGWANTAGNVAAQYRLLASPWKTVEIIGVILATGATATTFFQLPAGPPSYVPASQQQVVAAGTGGVVAGTSCFIGCDTSGNLTVHNGTIGAANSYLFHGFISLDA